MIQITTKKPLVVSPNANTVQPTIKKLEEHELREKRNEVPTDIKNYIESGGGIQTLRGVVDKPMCPCASNKKKSRPHKPAFCSISD